jgi:hypothetical protein
MKIRKAGAKIKNFLFAVLTLAFVAAVFLFFTNKYFFKVKNIEINENERYSYDEILQASSIVLGEELYGIDANQSKNNIKDILPYTETVNIKRIPPSTVNIEIETAKGFFGINFGGDYYIISENFKIVEKIKIIGNKAAESDFYPPDGIITFETDTVKKCYFGEEIEFFDSDIYDLLKEILQIREKNEKAFSRITAIDVTNKFKVVMNYSNKIMVNFGVFENISSKILNSFEIIDRLPDYAEGIIDMTDNKAVSFTYDENVFMLYKTN